MNDFYKNLGEMVTAIGLVFLISTGNGSILYLIYHHIHAIFPNAAANGIIAKELGWWDSVCVVWIFSILIRVSTFIHK